MWGIFAADVDRHPVGLDRGQLGSLTHVSNAQKLYSKVISPRRFHYEEEKRETLNGNGR
jgi:hypothetical protein